MAEFIDSHKKNFFFVRPEKRNKIIFTKKKIKLYNTPTPAVQKNEITDTYDNNNPKKYEIMRKYH